LSATTEGSGLKPGLREDGSIGGMLARTTAM
jgi:hypothetical protein